MPDAQASADTALGDIGRQALVAAATALATGLASLTFVAIVGGAVVMARLRGAGLPTEAGVAVQPRSVLLAVGGEVLAPAIAVALLTVFAVHFLPTSRIVVPEPAAAQTGDAPTGDPGTRNSRLARWFHEDLWDRHNILAALVALFAAGYYAMWSAGAFEFPFQTLIAVLMLGFAGAVGYVSGRLAATAVRARDERHGSTPEHLGDPAPSTHARLARIELAYLAGVALVIMLFATIAAVTASLADPKVRPAAVVFKDDRGPICGVYVAQNSDHVYIGTAVEDPDIRNVGLHREGRILDVPRSTVRGLVLGSGQSLSDAHASAPKLLGELMAVHHVQPAQTFGCDQKAISSAR
jgi:hypothetical protein